MKRERFFSDSLNSNEEYKIKDNNKISINFNNGNNLNSNNSLAHSENFYDSKNQVESLKINETYGNKSIKKSINGNIKQNNLYNKNKDFKIKHVDKKSYRIIMWISIFQKMLNI